MKELQNKEYTYKYIQWLIIFLITLTIPFFIISFENNTNEKLDNYNRSVTIGIEEGCSQENINQILENLEIYQITKATNRYKIFIIVLIAVTILCLFNYYYLKFGLKRKLIEKTPLNLLNSMILIVISIVEIIYLVITIVGVSPLYTGNNFWTMIFINILAVIISITIVLQYRFLKKQK